ncbi:MAG: hypothetical protein HYS32_02810 [Candidatus Woesearchaeota archaeon]|nr:MAG: hypothetical protein HYS32_02810 [Candidatus Woesearchaeota archaeon]
MTNLKDVKREIVNWYKTTYLNNKGIPYFEIDGVTGKPLSNRDLIPELGDYLPFLYYIGEKDYVNRQIKIAKSYLTKGIITKKISIPRGIPLHEKILYKLVPKHSESFEYTDLILGLLEVYEQSKDKEVLNFADYMLNKAFSVFNKDNVIHDMYFPSLKLKLPASSSLSGMYIELLADFYRLTKNKDYLTRAYALVEKWASVDFFNKYGVFPVYYTPNKKIRKLPIFSKYSKIAKLNKHNTTVIAAILALYQQTKDPKLLSIIEKWVYGLKKYFLNKDYIADEVIEINEGKKRILLKPEIRNFALIDFLADLYYTTKNKEYLNLAEKNAQFWINQQSDLGLIPFTPNGNYSRFDSQTDMGVAFMKLYELTNKKIYKNSAYNLLKAQLKYHHTKHGYVERVNPKTGWIMDYSIETRFTALFLKLLLTIEKNKKIYKDKKFYYLLRDR